MKKVVVLLVILIGTLSCKEVPTKSVVESEVIVEEINQGSFAHSVYFWLHNPESEADKTAFLTSLRKFIDRSPYIQTIHVGTPAATNREVIDNTYTFSLLLTFKDKAAQDKYQDEPAHKLFIDESSALWEKVLVYDSELLQASN